MKSVNTFSIDTWLSWTLVQQSLVIASHYSGKCLKEGTKHDTKEGTKDHWSSSATVVLDITTRCASGHPPSLPCLQLQLIFLKFQPQDHVSSYPSTWKWQGAAKSLLQSRYWRVIPTSSCRQNQEPDGWSFGEFFSSSEMIKKIIFYQQMCKIFHNYLIYRISGFLAKYLGVYYNHLSHQGHLLRCQNKPMIL